MIVTKLLAISDVCVAIVAKHRIELFAVAINDSGNCRELHVL